MAAKQRSLTSRQERFVREYLIDLNGTQAAIRSGYSEHSAAQIAYELLQNPLLLARVESLQDERAAALAITALDVVAGLLKIRDRSMQAEEVMEWDAEESKFVGTGEFRFDSNGANKASELIGKHLAMFVDRSEHTGKDGGPLTVQALDSFLDDTPATS
jgi:phage terminase small subunit